MTKPLEQLLAETKAIVEAANHSKSNFGDNPDFIAHARTMMPALIEALELAVEQRNKGYQSIIDEGVLDIRGELDQALANILRKAGDK